MLTLRLAKIACVAALALYAAVVAFGNVADYWTNFAFVTHVLDMDQLPKESSIRWAGDYFGYSASCDLSAYHRHRDRDRRFGCQRRNFDGTAMQSVSTVISKG